ncbi:MAG: carboxypeptidase regulatory-like domain-containing protein [Sandarakinorhabdus sp.]|nr:carboxypeptidase regulatory-like domain-containing protein [Sandarakinorhabdus sp.]
MRHLRLGVALGALAVPAFVIPAAVQAQETTAAIRGSIINEKNQPIAGATVTVIHTPSGTRIVQTSGANGEFNASGLRLGGPYSVTVEAAGFDPATETLDGLTAGTAQRVEVMLAATGQGITVTASRTRSAITIATGAATILTARDIAGIANVNRDIRNLALRNPLVSLNQSNNSISILGQNNRFNRFTVDGVAFGDPFGLEGSGQVSNRGPIPLDAIGEFSVEVAPVDIQQGFFQGGAINAQLISGSNKFHAMAGGFYQNDSLRGRRAGTLRRVGQFESQIYTAQLSGPIIKDKLFFAVTYERTRESVPAPLQPSQLTNVGPGGITDAQISRIQGIADTAYDYDAGGVAATVPERDDKLVAKIDWNIADGHRASFTYIYNESNEFSGATGAAALNQSSPVFSLQSNNFTAGAINHFGILQLNDQWSDNFSTMLRVSYADYERLQVPVGGRTFGQFDVCLAETRAAPLGACPGGTGQLRFGPDISRQSNELTSQSLNVEFAATLKMNNHTVKALVERRTQDLNNLFQQRTSGQWYFDSITDLQNRQASFLDFATPLRGGIETAAAIFANNSWTFGIMDTIDVSDDLTVLAGFRWDLFDTPDVPVFNPNFLDRFGFPNNSTLNGRQLFQPRFGFNWRASDRLQIRGSAGLFGGGAPNVWVSNSYSNPGPTMARASITRVPGVGGAPDTFTVSGIPGLSAADQNAIGAATLNNVSGGQGVPDTFIQALRGVGGAAGAPTNAIDPDFRVPSQWRVSGSVDYTANLGFLGDDWQFGADVIWSRTRDALTWTDLRSVPVGTLPDGRLRYGPLGGVGTTNSDILLTNTSDGYSWNIVGRFDKRWNNGLRLAGSYTFQRSFDVNSATSSVAFSNYMNAAAGFDPNNAAYGVSNYQRDDAFRLVASYDASLFGDNNTRIEFFFNSTSGQPFSFTMNDQASGNGRSAVFGTLASTSAGQQHIRHLLYVPNVSSITADPRVTYAPGFDFAGFQNFVQNSPLAEYQGQIAPKNIGRSPRVNRLDFALRQQVPFVFGGKIELSAEVENVLNLINPNWGVVRLVPFPHMAPAVNVACADAACTSYRFSNVSASATSFTPPASPIQIGGSFWGVRFGARVRF